MLQELLPQHDRFVDIGANIGFYSCLARQMGKPVVAVEPLATNVALLLGNLCANGWQDTEIVVAGLSDKAGIAGDISGAIQPRRLYPDGPRVPSAV